MKHFEPFARTPYSFEQRDAPDAAMTAIGKIVLNFSYLRETLHRCLHRLLGLTPNQAEAIAASTTFRQQLDILAAQLREPLGTGRLNLGRGDPHEICTELLAQCLMAERLRDQVIESSWRGPSRKLTRYRSRVHPASGLRIGEEEMDAAHLLDIADFIVCVAEDLADCVLRHNPDGE